MEQIEGCWIHIKEMNFALSDFSISKPINLLDSSVVDIISDVE